MPATAAYSTLVYRLNPFAFPADTSFRFILLIVLVTSASIYIFIGLPFSFLPHYKQEETRIRECIQNIPNQFTSSDPTAFVDNVTACITPLVSDIAIWAFGGVAFMLIVALALYWFYPDWKTRKDRLLPLQQEDAPGVLNCLEDLCLMTKLSIPLKFMWNPLNRDTGGFAFGHFGQYYVGLPGGLVCLFYTDKPAFRAILLHELAHLHNKDINKSCIAITIWWSFVATALFPYLIGLYWRSNMGWEDNLGFSWRVFALALLVFITRNGVLQARELYADVRASVWEESSDTLIRMIQGLRPLKNLRWGTLWLKHPNPNDRRHVLIDTYPLFHLKFRDIMTTGIAITVSLFPLMGLMAMPIVISGDFGKEQLFLSILAIFGALSLLAALAVSAISVGIWRSNFAALIRGSNDCNIGWISVTFALGMLIGLVISFAPGIGIVEDGLGFPQQREVALTGVIFGIGFVFTVLLLIALYCFFQWVKVGASTWLEVVLHARSPRPAFLTSLTLSTVMFMIVIGSLISITTLLITSLPQLHSSQDLSDISEFFIRGLRGLGLYSLPLFIALWAFPLLPWIWLRRCSSTVISNWAFLDIPAKPIILPPQVQLKPIFAAVLGLICGIVYLGFLVANGDLSVNFVNTVASNDAKNLMTSATQITVFLCLQTIVAIIVMFSIKRLPLIHTLLAAFMTACTITFGLLMTILFFGLEISVVPDTAALIFFQFIFLGTIISILVSSIFMIVKIPFWFLGSRHLKQVGVTTG